MDLRNTTVVVAALRERLEPVERVASLSALLDQQYPRARKAAVLLTLFERDGEPCLLFTRRASTLRAHSGEIAFPGGSVDVTDQSPVMTALREAEEEIGLEPARVRFLGLLSPVLTNVSNFVIVPVVAFLPQGPGQLSPQASEVAEIIFASLHGLADPRILHTEEWTREGVAHTIYFYNYGPYQIWGATARILRHLLSLLNDVPAGG